MDNTIHVHIDTLRYTRRGLEQTNPLQLQVGLNNRVVLVRPTRRPALPQSGVGFGRGSSFPRPGLLLTLWSARKVGSPFTYHTEEEPRWNGAHIQLFGHTCEGEPHDRKALSERRARVAQALCTSNVDDFHKIALEEEWGAQEIQAMLRSLSCDAGPVDGKAERLTHEAANVFAARFNRGVYTPSEAVQNEQLPLQPTLDDNFIRLLCGAFVTTHGLRLQETTFHSTHQVHGCCSYVAPPETKDRAPRVSFICHPSPMEYADNAPCTMGDSEACAIVDGEPVSCMWFREHYIETSPTPPRLFDGRWLWLKEDRYLLSAASTAADDEPVLFQVRDATRPNQVVNTLHGITRGGVASVVWTSGHPLEHSDEPPGFGRVEFVAWHPNHKESQTSEPWPRAVSLELIQLSDDFTALKQRSGGIRVRADDGSYEHYAPFSTAIARSSRHAVLIFPGINDNARIQAVLESGELRVTLLEGMPVAAVNGTCGAGEQCHELPPAPGPPDYDLDEQELDWTASVGAATVHEEPESIENTQR